MDTYRFCALDSGLKEPSAASGSTIVLILWFFEATGLTCLTAITRDLASSVSRGMQESLQHELLPS